MARIYHNRRALEYATPSSLLPGSDVLAFHQSLPGYGATPLIELPSIARDLHVKRLFLKDESSRLGLPAFKILGASWAAYCAIKRYLKLDVGPYIEDLAREVKGKGITLFAATQGNHGRAVARMARLLGIGCKIFVPRGMRSTTKVLIAGEGAEVVETPGDYDAAVQEASIASKDVEGGILVEDTAFKGYEEIPKWIVEGYTTLMVELEAQVLASTGGKHPDTVIVPVGVGSLAQAVVTYAKRMGCGGNTRIVTVEPDTAACLKKGLLNCATSASAPAEIDTASTIMAGLHCGTVSSLAWPILREGVDVCVSVPDIEVHRAVQELHAAGVDVGPCGAAPLAALRLLVAQSEVDILHDDSVVVLLATEGPHDYALPLDTTMTDPIALTQILTGIDSSNTDLSRLAGAGEAAIAEYLMGWLMHHEFEVHRLELRPGRPSVVGVARGSGGGKALMFNGHIDTVTTAGYHGNALSGEIKDGAVHGRGSFDMKAGIAASLVAAYQAREMQQLKGDIILALVADEENMSLGTEELLAAGWLADAAIVSEPTSLELQLCHKGFVWANVDIIGKAGHGSRPDLAVDAIAKAGHFLVAFEKYGEDLLASRVEGAAKHLILGTGTAHCSFIKGGEELSSYPARCTVSVERRTVPGETPQSVERELHALLDKLMREVPDFKAELHMGIFRPPFEIEKEHPFVKLVARHASDVLGEEVKLAGASFWADSALLADNGIPSLLFGVQGGGAHSSEEWAAVDSIARVTETLTRVAIEFCD